MERRTKDGNAGTNRTRRYANVFARVEIRCVKANEVRRWVLGWWESSVKSVIHSHRVFTAFRLVWHLVIRQVPCSSLHVPLEFYYASRLDWNFTDECRYDGDQHLSVWYIPVVLDWFLHSGEIFIYLENHLVSVRMHWTALHYNKSDLKNFHVMVVWITYWNFV